MDPALPAQARAARVIRSCSRFCPPLSIVPNPAADPGADAIHATTTRNATSLQRRRRTSRPPYRHHPELATPPTRPRRGITLGAGRSHDASATLSPCSRPQPHPAKVVSCASKNHRCSRSPAKSDDQSYLRRARNKGTSGHESHDPRPELNYARESGLGEKQVLTVLTVSRPRSSAGCAADSPQRQGARYTAAAALLVEPARRYPSVITFSELATGPT